METAEKFEINVDGRPVAARAGWTIAEAMLAGGIRTCRETRNQAPRGVFCGMGVCYECRMIVNGTPNVRTCMTLAAPGCEVETQKESEL
ncbi:MAG: (2Fe-2S)-binding protein [Desulfobacterales bacterium]|nr:(2Fe-2S)-binding protein [Desulfobacterales bacterium]